MSPAGNVHGRATALTLFTPLRHGALPYLRLLFWLAARLPLPSWTLLRLKRVHFGRWALVTHLPPGGRRRARRRLRRPVLFFESNFNGGFGGYIDAFAYCFPRGMWLIWGTSLGYPGAIPVGPFKRWITEQELVCSHYYSAYPEATTQSILAALSVREGLEELRREAAEMEPEAFRGAYERMLRGVQRHL